jgi:hypothetical protein
MRTDPLPDEMGQGLAKFHRNLGADPVMMQSSRLTHELNSLNLGAFSPHFLVPVG